MVKTSARQESLPRLRTTDVPHAAVLAEAAQEYLDNYGWRTDIVGNQLMLPLGWGTVGIAIAAGRAGELNHRLAVHGLTYPVVNLHGPRHRWVFLATREVLANHPPTAHFVSVLDSQHRIPLPPSHGIDGPVGWIVPPSRCSGGIPSSDPLLAVIRNQ
jgi:hypothetical protein